MWTRNRSGHQNVTCPVVAQSVMGTVSVAGYMASAAVL